MEVPGEKPLGAREKTNNKLNPHMASTSYGFHRCATLVPRSKDGCISSKGSHIGYS